MIQQGAASGNPERGGAMDKGSGDIQSRLVVKAVRNVRRGYEKDEAGRGMYRPGLRLDLQRSRLLTESYRETDGEPMVIRRAKAFRHILTNMDIYIQDWERIVGNHASTPEGLYFGIDMNWRSVERIVRGAEGQSLLDDREREELAELIRYWKGRSMSDRQQELFTGEILKYWRYEGTIMWTHWSELGIPNYEKIFKVGLKGIMEEARARFRRDLASGGPCPLPRSASAPLRPRLFPQVQILENQSASALPAPNGAPACALHADRLHASKPLR